MDVKAMMIPVFKMTRDDGSKARDSSGTLDVGFD